MSGVATDDAEREALLGNREIIPEAPPASLGHVLLYVHDIEAVAQFYSSLFGFQALREVGDRILELRKSTSEGGAIMLHPLGPGRKAGQSLAKLVFDCSDVEAFRARAEQLGIQFSAPHKADGYVFINAEDPAGNTVSVSSRVFRRGPLGRGTVEAQAASLSAGAAGDES